MTARITAVSAPHQQSALRVSTFGDSGSRDDGTHNAASTSVISTTGTFTRNTDPHQKRASSNPPMTGPAAVAMPATPDHTAIAWPRSSSGKTLPIVDSVAGIAHAPPTPISPRATVNAAAESANAAATDAVPKIASPIISIRLRP